MCDVFTTNYEINMQQTDSTQVASQTLDDSAVDQFFSSGGEEAPESIEVEGDPNPSQTEIVETQTPPEEQIVSNHHKALQEERTRRQEYQKQLQEQNQRMQQMETRFQQAMERLYQPAQQPPTFDEDPLGALRYNQERLAEFQQQQYAIEQHRTQQAEMQNSMQSFMHKYATDAKTFAQQNNDFGDAYKFLTHNRYQELQKMGYSDIQATEILKQDEMALAAKAYEDGVNPAERLYATAQYRGYKNATAQPNNAQKVAAYSKAKDSAVSLSNSAASSKGNQNVSLETLASMDNDEFDKYWDKVIKKG